jgi:4-amino-4-deoxy-L-arabinose transferase-like glycosyltransferase
VKASDQPTVDRFEGVLPRSTGGINRPAGIWTRGAALASSRYLDAAVLTTMVISIMVLNLVWVALDSDRLYWDYARHLGLSLSYREAFSLSDPIDFFTMYDRYPPLMYWVTNGFYALLGSELWVAIFSNVVFLSILTGATYGIGKTLWSRQVGLLSALFVATSPMFVSLFKEYMLDAPLSAMVALALYVLIKSEHFSDRLHSALFGITCGLGLLIKWTLPFFLLLPAGVSVLVALTRAWRERSGRRLLNVTAAGTLAILISSIWYGPNLSEFRADVDYSTSLPGSVQESPPIDSLSSTLWYFWNLVNNQLYVIPFLFFAAGVFYIFRKDLSATRNSPLVLCIVGGYIALTLIELKDFRYTMPMLPAVAVIATSWLSYVNEKARSWITVGLATYCIVAFVVISFGTSLLPRDITIPIKARSYTSNIFHLSPPESIRVKGIVVFAQHGFIISQPSDEEWHKEDLFREMAARSNGEQATFWYSAGPETIWFTTWDTWYFSLKYDALWLADPAAARFLIIRGPVQSDVTAGFVKIKEFRLPYDGPLGLYQRV